MPSQPKPPAAPWSKLLLLLFEYQAACSEPPCCTGQELAQDPGLPVYLYGHACAAGTSLAEIRRSLGYFTPTSAGESLPTGWTSTQAPARFVLQMMLVSSINILSRLGLL